jgi:hypothetical protein
VDGNMARVKNLNYSNLVDNAMRGILRLALKRIEEKPKDVCYLLVINTKHKGIVAPKFIKEAYPNEMTMLMKNKFSDFVLKGNSFEISITFNKKQAFLTIPIESILFFSDQNAGIEFRFAEDNIRDIRCEIVEECDFDCDKEGLAEEEYSNNLINFSDLKKSKK